MRLLSHTNWRALLLLLLDVMRDERQAEASLLICEFLLCTFPNRRRATAAVSHSHLPHFVARTLLLFRRGLDQFRVNCLRCANDQSQRNNGTLAVAQCQLVAITKQKHSKANRNRNWNWNWNWIRIGARVRFAVIPNQKCEQQLQLSATITLAGTTRLRPKADQRQQSDSEAIDNDTKLPARSFVLPRRSERTKAKCMPVCVYKLQTAELPMKRSESSRREL